MTSSQVLTTMIEVVVVMDLVVVDFVQVGLDSIIPIAIGLILADSHLTMVAILWIHLFR